MSALRSLLGVKRTWVGALHMSAFDPKRTLGVWRLKSILCVYSSPPDRKMLGLLGPHAAAAQVCCCDASRPWEATMRRRDFVTRIGATIILGLGVSLLAVPTPLKAQKAAGIKRVGWLEVCGPGPKRPHFDIFRNRLAELGYVEGKNLTIEQRFA